MEKDERLIFCLFGEPVWRICWVNQIIPGLAQDITNANAETRDRTGDFQIFGLTLSQLSYRGLMTWIESEVHIEKP